MRQSRRPRSFGTRLLAAIALGCLLPSAGWAAPVTLNLKNADINTLIATVAEVSGRNFVVDPRVKGKVSVVSSAAMEKEELYQVFLSILEVHGFAAVPAGNVTKIVPDANAKQSGMPLANEERPGQGDEIVTRVVQVENVSAAQLVPILRPLIPQQGHLAAYSGTNVLIVSDRAANIGRLIKIIERIDLQSDSDLEVISLKYASATEVVRVLSTLEKGPRQVQDQSAQTKLVADERTNSILISGDRVDRLRMRAIISHLDTPLESTGNTHVVYLRYAKAKELATVLADISQDIERGDKFKGQKPGVEREVGIQADEAANALVITAPPRVFESLRAVIGQLDIRRAQVLVEAILADVSTRSLGELGIQWNEGLSGDTGNVVRTQFPGTDSGPIASFTADTFGTGFTFGVFKNGNIRALLRALASDSTTNLLGTPTLVTLDNEEAEIVVGQNVPFVTGQFTNTTSTPDNPFQTIERQDVGVVLKVKPQINEGNAVMLEISQEISNVDRETSGGIITNKRSIDTNVLVDDGQIVVLGGLISDDYQTTEQKVPLLGDIPVVGALFRNKRVDAEKRNLMIFLKPSIVRTQEDISYLTSRKYNYLRARQLAQPATDSLLTPNARVPSLPEYGELFREGEPDPGETQTEERRSNPFEDL